MEIGKNKSDLKKTNVLSKNKQIKIMLILVETKETYPTLNMTVLLAYQQKLECKICQRVLICFNC